MKKLTKILSTISSRVDAKMLQDLIDAGANGFRFNTAHQTFDESVKLLELVRSVSKDISVIVDTKGPEVRTTMIKEEGGKLNLQEGDKIKIKGGSHEEESSREILCLNYPEYVRDVPVSTLILIDDGEIGLEVVNKDEEFLHCVVKNDGVIGSRKSVNTPGVRIKLPSLSEKDKEFIQFAIEHKVDFIAHSFVRDKNDVMDIKELLQEKNADIGIISKIENQEGVDNLDEIIDVSDGIMVARGDLGIEVPLEKIPFIQKDMIKKCKDKSKFVITATQMLHTMIEKPRPTRAEVSDVANAVYDGTDCLMLSGETANGKYPIEAVKTMAKIAIETEKHLPRYTPLNIKKYKEDALLFVDYLRDVAVSSVESLPVKSFIADTNTGRVARDISSLRPTVKTMVLCYQENLVRKLSLTFGLECYYNQGFTYKDGINKFLEELVEKEKIKKEDLVVALTRDRKNDPGTTSLQINHVRNIV